VFQLPYKTEKH